MQRGDRRLQLVRAAPPLLQRGVEHRQALADCAAVPARAVLLLEQHQRAVGADAGRAPRIVQQHQREQAARLGLVGHQRDQQPAEADRLGAQSGRIRPSCSVVA